MKTTYLLLLALLSFSCIQEEDIFNGNEVQYQVECGYCIVYFNDNPYSEKHFVITGKWNYEFISNDLDSVYLRLGKSALIDPIQVNASIKVGGKEVASYNELLGWDEVTIKHDLR